MRNLNDVYSIQTNHIMKAINRMKAINASKTFFTTLTLALGVVIFSACDDGSAPEVISVMDAEGSYSGKAVITYPESAETPTPYAEVELQVRLEKDTIYFDKFPTDELITSLVEEAYVADAIELTGDVGYKIGYKPALNEDYTQIKLTLDPKPLAFTLKGYTMGESGDLLNAPVEATIAKKEDGIFTYDGRTLKFKLTLESAKVDDNPSNINIEVEEITFELNKK